MPSWHLSPTGEQQARDLARSPVWPSSDPATIRWPVELTGRNSVSPSTMPSASATTSDGASTVGALCVRDPA
jgi:hypothetical protein